MTVSTTTSRADYTGNGTTTAFAVPFYFLDDSHLTVLRTQISTGVITTLAITTNYTVSGAGNPAGGTVTCVVAPTTDQKISILRNVPLTQLNTYVPNDPFPAASHERALDKLTMEVQQLDEAIDRALTLPANTAAGSVSAALPSPVANRLIGWDNTATALQNVDAQTLATIITSGNTYSDLFSGNGVQTAFTLSNNPGSVSNLDVSISGVTQRPNIDYTWVSGTTLTISPAPAAGTNNILVRYGNALPQGVTVKDAQTFDTVAIANSAGIDVTVGHIRTAGYYTNGDNGGALYKRYTAGGSPTTGAGTKYITSNAGAVIWELSDPSNNVRQFGAAGDGTTNDTPAIQAAIDAANAAGGGIVYFPPGTYATTTGITLGNGTNSTPSSRDNKVRLVGASYGSGAGLTNQQVNGTSRILYTGSASATTAVVNLAGPMHSVGIENLTLDCNSLAGRGLIVNHVTQGTFTRVSCRNYTAIGYDLTTRTGNPVGAAYGCADNRFYDCYGFIDTSIGTGTVIGVSLDSGVSTGTGLASQPDSARNVFIGGTYFYGQTASSYGMYLRGADNNYVSEVQFFPYNGSTSGFDVWFQRWPASGDFPLENFFSNLGMTRGVSGDSGVGSNWGNTFYPYPTSDGAAFPSLTGASGTDHTGKTYIAGTRAYQGRQVLKAESQTSQSTSSTSYSNITGYSITLTTLASTKLKISFSASCTKNTSGNGLYGIALNGSLQGATQQQVGATGYYQPVTCVTIVDVGAGSQTITAQFRSDNANATLCNNGVLTVEELY